MKFVFRWMRPLIELWAEPSAEHMAARCLQDAQRGLVKALDELDAARATVGYHQARIERLTSKTHGDRHDKAGQAHRDESRRAKVRAV
jgi:hypothetical protein